MRSGRSRRAIKKTSASREPHEASTAGPKPFDSRRLAFALRRIRQALIGTAPPVVTLIAEADRDPYKVLFSTILSARTKDETTAAASARLFRAAPEVNELAQLSTARIAELIFPVGFYRTKAKNVQAAARTLVEDFGGVVPKTIDELVELPGVGRKTANLVLTEAFHKPAICVDTHVHRICNLWGYVETRDPLATEMELRDRLPRRHWIDLNKTLVSFGQQICTPTSPWCSRCPVTDWCPRIGVGRTR
jgi:endonuclease III